MLCFVNNKTVSFETAIEHNNTNLYAVVVHIVLEESVSRIIQWCIVGIECCHIETNFQINKNWLSAISFTEGKTLVLSMESSTEAFALVFILLYWRHFI